MYRIIGLDSSQYTHISILFRGLDKKEKIQLNIVNILSIVLTFALGAQKNRPSSTC